MRLESVFTPLVGEPALLIEGGDRVLVVCDLHLGLERELYQRGFSLPSQTGRMLERLKSLVDRWSPDVLVLLGDVKHNVPQISWQEKQEIPRFLGELAGLVRVEIVPGNHDGGLAGLAGGISNLQVRSPRGFSLDGVVGYLHGHTWPAPELLECCQLVMAHTHPVLRFTDLLGGSSSWQVWVRARVKPGVLEDRFPGVEVNVEKVTVMPAFNQLCGGTALNEGESLLGPLQGVVCLEEAEVYLLDGLFLGRLGDLKTCPL